MIGVWCDEMSVMHCLSKYSIFISFLKKRYKNGVI